jgi:hypothetical protein
VGELEGPNLQNFRTQIVWQVGKIKNKKEVVANEERNACKVAKQNKPVLSL